MKLYEGGFDGWNQTERKYLKEFSKTKTRYIWVEFSIKVKTNKEYNLEYFINFYDDAGQYKAKVDTLKNVENGNKDNVLTFLDEERKKNKLYDLQIKNEELLLRKKHELGLSD